MPDMRRSAGWILWAMAASGCADVELAATELVRASEVEGGGCAPGPAKLDILLVIDDSSSMADNAALLADNLAGFAVYLEAPDVRLDYRVAITTTDVHQPYCGPGPQDGAFVASPCRARLDDFVVAATHEGPAADLRGVCTDACGRDELAIVPTALTADGELAPRPWIERIAGQRNLPEHVSTAEALACLGLVGAAGCTYESPLEAAYLALLRTFDRDDPAHGFLRDDAALFVLFISDETDCSVRPEHADIFDPAGPRALWEPGASSATSAVCWNAGMRCVGEGPVFDDCVAASVGADGALLDDDDDAVLYPVSRYAELLRQIERQKQAARGDDGRHVFVHVLGGVPSFGGFGGAPFFAEAHDEIERMAFGIGPACSRSSDAAGGIDLVAHPPGRLRELAEQFQRYDNPLFSLCDDNYAQALACLPGQSLVAARCVEGCVGDLDRETDVLEHDCVLTETLTARDEQHVLPVCEREDDAALDDSAGTWRIPDDAAACVRWRQGDALDPTCLDRGDNVGFEVRRRVPLEEPVCLRAVCSASQLPSLDCPGV